MNNEFLRFLIAGGINTLTGIVAYELLLPILYYKTDYIVTYIGGIVLSYYLNSRFVFHQPLQWKKAFQFPLVYMVQLLAGVVLLSLLVEALHISEVIAPVLVIVCTIPVTFLLSRVIIKGRTVSSGVV